MQVPATAIVKHASGANKALIKAVDGCFNGSPEMTVTETGIDDTLLSYMRCCVAPKEHLVDAGWRSEWTPDGGDPNLPLDVMSRLVEPIDFNTEAKVCSCWLCAAQGAACCQPPRTCSHCGVVSPAVDQSALWHTSWHGIRPSFMT